MAIFEESQIQQPTLTPMIADGVMESGIAHVYGLFFPPTANDLPASDLQLGFTGNSGMSTFCIPRHGSRPIPAPQDWPPHARLPGAINSSFADGHVESTKLENLWQLDWHRNYQAPAKRPGLQ